MDIRHNVNIKASPGKVYQAITTQQGLSGWWAKNTTATPQVGSVNVFTFGSFRNEMEITKLVTDKQVEWLCINSIDQWMNTPIRFDLENIDGRTMLRFTHSGWKAVTDTFASSNYDWGRFMSSLKSFCETGTGTPS